MRPTGDRLRDPRHRAERATRILDVAAQLLLRHGYRRVTIDDVAAGANIGKGTVYLHWKTRDELFLAVFDREVVHAVTELMRDLRQDPQVCLLHRFTRAYFLAIMNRPLMRGVVLADTQLVGKLAKPRDDGAHDDRHQTMFRAYLALLAQHGLLRNDMDIDAIAYALLATLEGFLRADTATDSGHPAASLNQRADLLASTVKAAFESGRAIRHRDQQSIATAVLDLLAGLVDADRTALGAP